MPFFEVEKRQYPSSRTTASNLVKRWGGDLALAIARVMLKWVQDDKKPGRQEIDMVGCATNKEMIADVRAKMDSTVDPFRITRAWTSVRKSGYKEMRDECFSLFVEEIEAAVRRRK